MTEQEREHCKEQIQELVHLRDTTTKNLSSWEEDFIDSMEEKLNEKPFFLSIRQRESIRKLLDKYT